MNLTAIENIVSNIKADKEISYYQLQDHILANAVTKAIKDYVIIDRSALINKIKTYEEFGTDGIEAVVSYLSIVDKSFINISGRDNAYIYVKAKEKGDYNNE